MAIWKRAWRVKVRQQSNVILDVRINHTEHSDNKAILLANLNAVIPCYDENIEKATNMALSEMFIEGISKEKIHKCYWVRDCEITINDFNLPI